MYHDLCNLHKYIMGKILHTIENVISNKTTSEKINKLCGPKVRDILLYRPVKIINCTKNIHQTKQGDLLTVCAKVVSHKEYHTRSKNRMIKVKVLVDELALWIVFFNYSLPWVNKLLKKNQTYEISGVLRDNYCIFHPHYIRETNTKNKNVGFQPFYNCARYITEKSFHDIMRTSLQYVDDLYEWHTDKFLKDNNWPNIKDAMQKLHFPTDNSNSIYDRLRYDEFLSYFLQMNIFKIQNLKGEANKFTSSLQNILLQNLPFQLTDDQKTVVQEITNDQLSNQKMLRLVHGDVGSGKTVVAFIALLNAIEAGRQAVLLVPTYLLAIQHHRNIVNLMGSNIEIELLTSATKKKARTLCLQRLLTHEVNLLIGTHAILQEDVVFKDLGLVVIDEQHRFGVSQRMSIVNRGKNVDLLMFSATPIPRTFSQMINSYIDVSRICQLPAGRKKVETTIMNIDKIDQLVSRIQRLIKEDCSIYWVCPMITQEDEENSNSMASVESVFNRLKKTIDEKYISYLHSNLKDIEKQQIIDDFKSGATKIIVSTTVIEIGIDVPNANIIIIEHAERFGLSQLHQLRGRVGRGNKKSFCILLYSMMNSIIRKRLEILRNSNDGFHIAEQDLEIRGGGDLIGVNQSGFPQFVFSDCILQHSNILRKSSQHAKEIVYNDNINNYSNLLDLFGRELTQNTLNI